MQAQDALYKETVGDGQAAEILADLNANNIENRAPINQVDSYMRKDMLAENKLLMILFWTEFSALMERHRRCF